MQLFVYLQSILFASSEKYSDYLHLTRGCHQLRGCICGCFGPPHQKQAHDKEAFIILSK